MRKVIKCIDCEKELSRPEYRRCRRCYGKSISGENHYCYIKERPRCMDCGKMLDLRTRKKNRIM